MKDDPEDDIEELFPDPVDADELDPVEQEVVEKASKAARKLEPIVLAHVLRPNYQPVKPRVIAKQLDLPSEQHKALKLAIKRLTKAGKVTYGAGHLVRPPKPQAKPSDRKSPKAVGSIPHTKLVASTPPTKAEPSPRDSKNIVIGRFRRTARGFGFVRPQGSKRGDKSGDIYIAAGATMDASDRDT